MNARFEEGDTVVLERTASVPTATVEDVFSKDGETYYRLSWSNGNTNEREAAEIDKAAIEP